MNKLFLILYLITFISCGGGTSDTLVGLGQGYYYKGEGKGHNLIFKRIRTDQGHTIDSIIIYPEVEKFTHNKEYIIIRQKASIKSHVSWFAMDISHISRSFRYVDSLPLNEVPQMYLKTYNINIKDSTFYRWAYRESSVNNTLKDQQFFKKIADSIIKNDPYYQKIYNEKINYWIIDKQNNRVLGPFNKEIFLTKSEEINIDLDLDIKKGMD